MVSWRNGSLISGAWGLVVVIVCAGGFQGVDAHETHRHKATVYADKYIGLKTASGQCYDPHAKTAAHPFLPLGSVVQVTNELNGKTIIVAINDRCVQVLDLSKSAAKELGISGTAPVSVKVIEKPQRLAHRP